MNDESKKQEIKYKLDKFFKGEFPEKREGPIFLQYEVITPENRSNFIPVVEIPEDYFDDEHPEDGCCVKEDEF